MESIRKIRFWLLFSVGSVSESVLFSPQHVATMQAHDMCIGIKHTYTHVVLAYAHHTHTHTHTHTQTHTYTHTQTHTHSLTRTCTPAWTQTHVRANARLHYVHTHTCTHVRAETYFILMCTHTYIYTHALLHLHAHTHSLIHTHTCTYTHTHTHARTHIYTHARTRTHALIHTRQKVTAASLHLTQSEKKTYVLEEWAQSKDAFVSHMLENETVLQSFRDSVRQFCYNVSWISTHTADATGMTARQMLRKMQLGLPMAPWHDTTCRDYKRWHNKQNQLIAKLQQHNYT